MPVLVLPAKSVAVTTSALLVSVVRVELRVACHCPSLPVVAVPMVVAPRVMVMTEPASALPLKTTLLAVLVMASPITPVSEVAANETVGATGATLSLTTVKGKE